MLALNPGPRAQASKSSCKSRLACCDVVLPGIAGPAAVMSCLRDKLKLKLSRITACQPESLEACSHLVQAVFDSDVTKEALSELYDLCIDFLDSSNLNQAVTSAAAALVFLGSAQPSELVLRQYTQNVFLQLAAAAGNSAISNQVLQPLTALLASRQAWNIAYEILLCAHDSLAAQSACQAYQSSGTSSISTANHTQQHEATRQISVQLPVPTASNAIRELVAAAVRASTIAHQQNQSSCPAVQQIMHHCIGPLFTNTCGLLASPVPPLRKAAFQQLLPALLQAAEAVNSNCRLQCMQQLWQQCLTMIAAPALPRRMGLAVLLQYCSEWPIQPPSATALATAAATQEAAAEAAPTPTPDDSSEQFWALLRDCLVDSEALNRKRAFRLMQLLLPDDMLQQQPVWSVFTALYDLLDEFSPHLVKASWPLVSELHPVAREFASSDADSDVAISNQINLLKVTDKDQHQQELVQVVSDALPLSFRWSQVLWTRALQHKNLQVQRMALKTLLKRSWSPGVVSQVPPSFITAVLLPALLSPVHHKVPAAAGLSATGGVTTAGQVTTTTPTTPATATAGGISSQQRTSAVASAHPSSPSGSSSSSAGFSVIKQGADVLARYTAAVESAAARDVLSGGLDMLAAPGVDMPRSGLLVVLSSLAAAAAASGQQGALLRDLSAVEAAAYSESSLNKLHALLARLATYSGHRFRVDCYNMLLTIAAAVAPLGPCTVAAAARLLQNMPTWMQSPGGPLNHSTRAWLLGSNNSSCAVLRAGVTNMFQQYFSSSSSSQHRQQHCQADARDYTSWRSMSDAWIRVIVSCDVDLQQQLAAAASDLSSRVDQLISRSYLAPGAAEKALVMMTHLFESAESAGVVAREAAQQLPVVTQLAVRIAEAVAEPLGANLVAYCQCYRCQPADMAGSSSSSSGGDGGGAVVRAGLSASAWAAAARAEVAAQAAAAGAVVLARWISGQWSSSSNSSNGSNGSPSAAQQHALPALLQLLTQLAHVGNQISAEPLPTAQLTPTGAARQQASLDLSAAAAAEQSRASALKVLCHAALGITRSMLLCPDVSLHSVISSTSCSPVQWINAVIRETAAAQATQHQRQQAAGVGSSGSPPSGLPGDMDWKCCDAVMMLTAVTTSNRCSSSSRDRSDSNGISSHSAAASVNSIRQRAPAANIPAGCSYSSTRARPAADQISDPSCPFLLPGVLSGDVVTVMFHQCLSALQWVSSERGSDLVQLMRCIRRLWVAAVDDRQLQAAVHRSLAAAGLLLSPDSSSSSTPLSQLAAVLANGLLDMLRTSKKRPQIMYSLIINTLLIPQLLCPAKFPTALSNTDSITHLTQEDLAALHEGPHAPLRRFVQGLLSQGCKGSSRLMLALGLQLGAAVSVNPQVGVWYCDELRQLVMFGVATQGAAGDERTQCVPSVEDTLERQLLHGPVDPELQAAYTLTDIGPRVAVCCGLYELAQQAGLVQHSQPETNSNSGSVVDQWVADVEAAGVLLWQNWLQSLLHDSVLSSERFKVGSDIHRLKVRAWQGLATLTNFISTHRQRGVAAAAVRELLIQLTINNPPSIKQYQEAVLAHLLLQHQGLLEELLLPQFASVEKGNTATGSHILISVQVALHSPPACQTRVLPVLVKQLLPWTNHHTHNIRTFAQLGFCAIMDTKPLDEWAGWREGLGAGGVEVLRDLLRFMHENVDFQRFRKAMGAGISRWSAVGVISPRRIFSSTLHLAGAEETPVTFEGVPETLMDRLIVFLTAERAKLREAAVDRVAGYERLTAHHGPADTTFLRHKADKNAAGEGSTGAAVVVTTSVGGPKGDFQRKVSHYERAALLADVLEELEDADVVGGPAGTQRHALVVVASLISKAPNLGGLARTAEVLGAGALVIGDKRLATEAGFTSVSVTAERWVPLIEVSEAVLIPWLSKKQAEGYTLVGLEQTAGSTCLPSYKFASKTVLVLGREKEGIPPEIIAMLDATVEIPQLGVIRSLNVHVSGAIAMYEYAKQQLPAEGAQT